MKVRIALFCLLGGLAFTTSALGAGHFGWWWIAGVLICASVAPLVIYGPRRLAAQFSTISIAIIVVGLVCTISEGMLFFPEQREQIAKSLWGGIVLYLIAAAVLVGLGRVLKLRRESAISVEPRNITAMIPMVLLGGLSYVIYYLIFGAIVFQLYTKQFYPHAAEQVAALGGWFWAYQLGRGLLMVLSVLPVIYTLRLPRWKAALVVGLLVWVVGGLAPLLVPNATMIAPQRYAHIVEILTQNFSLGVTATFLLRKKTATAGAQMESAAAI